MKKIDTHQHLLSPDRFDYSWTKDLPALQGPFPLDGYQAAAEGCDIEGSLFMEVDVDDGQNIKEAEFFTQLAADSRNNILGVIASAYPEAADFEAQLEQLTGPYLKGIRRVLHTQDGALSQDSAFRERLTLLEKHGLGFDLCARQDQLAIALELVRACPGVHFILDHCGIPDIANHLSRNSDSWQQWQTGIHALGAEPNVHCKFSGITAYAAPEQRNPDGLRPYLSEILEAFGPQRIVWGGDWPVCNLADGLQRWSQITEQLLGELSADERSAILIQNARRIYKI